MLSMQLTHTSLLKSQLENYNSQTSNWENSRPSVGLLKKRLQERGEWLKNARKQGSESPGPEVGHHALPSLTIKMKRTARRV